ncbi:hypothetical protein LX36DRAFT_363286 [Colletotrichum falcatum]|nr:hypothetical protein LX36DRAFT_363286 [Colletotrichum falcatum]
MFDRGDWGCAMMVVVLTRHDYSYFAIAWLGHLITVSTTLGVCALLSGLGAMSPRASWKITLAGPCSPPETFSDIFSRPSIVCDRSLSCWSWLYQLFRPPNINRLGLGLGLGNRGDIPHDASR